MLLPSEIIVDNFCGCGGASTAMAQGVEQEVDVAINHSPAQAQKSPQAYRAGRSGVREIPIRLKPLTKTEQVELIGNSVSPPPAAALVRANFPKLDLRMAA